MKSAFFTLIFLLIAVFVRAQCSISLTYTPASCPTCYDGCVTANVITGCPPYTISWYPSDPNFPVVCSAYADTTYITTVTDNCGCTSSDTITVTGTTGIYNNNENVEFSIRPNPTSNLLTITVDSYPETINAAIIDMYGNIIMNVPLNQKENVLTINNLADGIYFVVISGNNKISTTEKLVKIP